jgi:hypothetical protein
MMTRIADEHPDSHLTAKRETGEKYDPLVLDDENAMPEPTSQIPMGDQDPEESPMSEAMQDRARRASDAFVAASKARWARKNK